MNEDEVGFFGKAGDKINNYVASLIIRYFQQVTERSVISFMLNLQYLKKQEDNWKLQTSINYLLSG